MGRDQKQAWPKVRKFFNDIHLWGGLISGIVVFVVCLTGTIYVYNSEIREASIPQYYHVEVGGEKLSPDALLAQVKPKLAGKLVGIKVPFAEDATTAILFTKKEEGKGEGRVDGKSEGRAEGKNEGRAEGKGEGRAEDKGEGRAEGKDEGRIEDKGEGRAEGKVVEKAKPQAGGGGRGPRANQLMVNPYTGAVIGDPSEEKTNTAAFMQSMFGLHRWLLLNEIKEPIFEGVENRKLGSWITGSATLLFLLGVISGMVIWFPAKLRGWKNGLKIKLSANWKRINHDIHNTLGLYSCIILFLMAVTGPFWSFDWYRTGWQKTWGTYKSADAPKVEKVKLLSKIPEVGEKPLSIEATISAANALLPYDGDITINFASDSVGTINIAKNRVGFFAPSAGDKLVLDQYSGALLEKDIFREKPFNERASASIKALHIGDIYGPFTKLLYFISCLIATSLPVTGVLIWVNKMKKKPKKNTAQ